MALTRIKYVSSLTGMKVWSSISSILMLSTRSRQLMENVQLTSKFKQRGRLMIVGVSLILFLTDWSPSTLLYDEEDSFILEADLLVEMKLFQAENPNSTKSKLFGEEIKSIFNDDKNADVLVITGDQEFKCHKAILSARSEVFKNTLAHPVTVESNMNTIVIKETTVKAVKDMLNYIYSGDVPDDPKTLTTDLLDLANMYQLKPLLI